MKTLLVCGTPGFNKPDVILHALADQVRDHGALYVAVLGREGRVEKHTLLACRQLGITPHIGDDLKRLFEKAKPQQVLQFGVTRNKPEAVRLASEVGIPVQLIRA